jgi:hypothetical protein
VPEFLETDHLQEQKKVKMKKKLPRKSRENIRTKNRLKMKKKTNILKTQINSHSTLDAGDTYL